LLDFRLQRKQRKAERVQSEPKSEGRALEGRIIIINVAEARAASQNILAAKRIAIDRHYL
jgi:hypothetical protein